MDWVISARSRNDRADLRDTSKQVGGPDHLNVFGNATLWKPGLGKRSQRRRIRV
jgi:hypothetical protein